MAKGSTCLKVLGGGLVLGAVLLGLAWLRRDAILESTLEKNIEAATGVPAEIDSVQSEPFQGQFTIDEFTLKNPKGFASPYVLKIDSITLVLDPGSVFQETVQVQSLTVEGIEVKLEQKLTKNNLAEIVEHLQASGSGSGSGQGGNGGGGGKTVKIDQLEIRDINATIKISAIAGLGLTRTLEIDNIEVENIDSYNAEGKLSGALVTAVANAILKEVAGSVDPGNILGP